MPDGWEGNCGPGGKQWQPTAGFMTMHVCHCGPGGRWWQPTTGFMTMHAVTCRLTAKYGISSGPKTQPMSIGLTFTFTILHLSLGWVSRRPANGGRYGYKFQKGGLTVATGNFFCHQLQWCYVEQKCLCVIIIVISM